MAVPVAAGSHAVVLAARASRGLAAGLCSSSEKRGKEKGPLSFVLTFLIAVLLAASCALSAFALPEPVERWRSEVVRACTLCELDAVWVDLILAMMAAESGGDEGVSSVLGAKGDIMQAAEGAYGFIVLEGSSEYGVTANTPEASIVAGVLEFKGNLELWEGRFGEIDPLDLDKVGLVVQGYNFGALGWFNWCAERGVEAYSVDLASTYSQTMMPPGAKGTPSHAQKVLSYYFSPALLSGGEAVSAFVAAALAMANDDSIGYSQASRNLNPNVDCSSLVWLALKEAGFPANAIGLWPFSTYTMEPRLAAAGFARIDFVDAQGDLRSGDILLRNGHTEIVYDPRDFSTIGAHADYDGRDGDSSGEEVDVSSGNARSGWECVWRYMG